MVEDRAEYHILYYGIFDFYESPLVSIFSEKGKGSSQYGSIIDKTIKDSNFIEKMINNKIDLKSLFLNHDEKMVIMNKVLIDYFVFIKKDNFEDKVFYEICISRNTVPRSLPMSILNNKQKIDYTALFGKSKEATQNTLLEFIDSFESEYNLEANNTSEHVVEIDNEMNEILAVMNDNINQVLIRDDRLDNLQQKTLKLTDKGKKFKRTTKKMESKEVWKNRKWKTIFVGSVLLVVVLFITFERIFTN